jgi:hypothetical protein
MREVKNRVGGSNYQDYCGRDEGGTKVQGFWGPESHVCCTWRSKASLGRLVDRTEKEKGWATGF